MLFFLLCPLVLAANVPLGTAIESLHGGAASEQSKRKRDELNRNFGPSSKIPRRDDSVLPQDNDKHLFLQIITPPNSGFDNGAVNDEPKLGSINDSSEEERINGGVGAEFGDTASPPEEHVEGEGVSVSLVSERTISAKSNDVSDVFSGSTTIHFKEDTDQENASNHQVGEEIAGVRNNDDTDAFPESTTIPFIEDSDREYAFNHQVGEEIAGGRSNDFAVVLSSGTTIPFKEDTEGENASNPQVGEEIDGVRSNDFTDVLSGRTTIPFIEDSDGENASNPQVGEEIAGVRSNDFADVLSGRATIPFIEDSDGENASNPLVGEEIAGVRSNDVSDVFSGRTTIPFKEDTEGENASNPQVGEEIGGVRSNDVSDVFSGRTTIPFIEDTEGENASNPQVAEEIAGVRSNDFTDVLSGRTTIPFIEDTEGETASNPQVGEEIAGVKSNDVTDALSGRTTIPFIEDTDGENAFNPQVGEEIAGMNSNDVTDRQSGSTSIPFREDTKGENAFVDVIGNRNSGANNDQANFSEDTLSSRLDADESYFDYDQLKSAILSGEGASDFSTDQSVPKFPSQVKASTPGQVVVTLEGVDGKKYSWRIAQRIGHGASGIVYRADKVDNLSTPNTLASPLVSSSSPIDRMASVAIKFASDKKVRTSVVEEANRLNRMKNTPGVPQLVSVARYGEHGGVLMVSEFFPRGDLARYLRKNPSIKLSSEAMWVTAKDAFAKLDAIHREYNICHGDIKPSNLFLNDQNKIVFGDWGNGKTFTISYSLERFLKQHDQIRPVDDFVSLFLSIFQMDHTLTFDPKTYTANNLWWRGRDKRTGQKPKSRSDLALAVKTWDDNMSSSLKKNGFLIQDRGYLWEILNESPHRASLAKEVSDVFQMKCFTF